MRKISVVTVAAIVGIAIYFTVSWGFDGLRVLASPTYGLEDVWSSQYVFGIGRLMGLAPQGLIQLAAFFGVLKLAVAAICALHIADRLRSLFRGNANLEIAEGGFVLAVLIAIASAVPAAMSHNVELMHAQGIQLAIAGLALALCMVERNYGNTAKYTAAVTLPNDPQSFTPWR